METPPIHYNFSCLICGKHKNMSRLRMRKWQLFLQQSTKEPNLMGILSCLARKGKSPILSAIEKSHGASTSDNTEDNNGYANASTSSNSSPPMFRSFLSLQEIDNIFLTANNKLSRNVKGNHVHFSVSLEDVYYVENYCKGNKSDFWLDHSDYMNRYKEDKASIHVTDSMTIPTEIICDSTEGSFSMSERDYLKAFDEGYIQFCTSGQVDKSTERALVRGIERGYRALERFSISYRSQAEMCQRIRSSTIQTYKLLEAHGHLDNENLQLRNQCEILILCMSGWAMFIGRLDRIAARRCMKSKYGESSIQPTFEEMNQQNLYQDSRSYEN